MCMQIYSVFIRHYDGGVCTDMKAICQMEIKKVVLEDSERER